MQAVNNGKKRIYIAGPYTGGDVAENVAAAMEAWHKLADAGLYPFCPHLSHFLHIHRQRPYAEWLDHDLAWLDACHAVLRLPGRSPGAGADGEVARANEMGIPVFVDLEGLVRWAQA